MTVNDTVIPIEILTYSVEEGTVNGHTVTKGAYPSIHEACIALTVPYAQQAGHPVLTHAVDTIGQPVEYWLHVHPDGQATPAASEPRAVQSVERTPAADGPPPSDTDPVLRTEPAPTSETADPPMSAVPTTRASRRPAVDDDAAIDREQGETADDPPRSVSGLPPSPTAEAIRHPVAPKPAPVIPTLGDLLAARPGPPTGPAQLGWRVAARRLTGGLIRLGPSRAEVIRRRAIVAVQRSLTGPKTVVVINPKAGANKTTATLLIAATFGIHRGGYTLAWDNNETRGTMGWRASQGRHTNTAVDLLRELDRFTDARSARVGDLDNFVRGQGNAQFDVLASDEDATSAASIDADAFNALHHSLSRFYRVIVVDTGNNMRASNWDAALKAADQIVIVSTIREDTAQSAAWVADALNDKGYRNKVADAVTILAAPSLRPDPALTSRLVGHFGQLTRAVVQVPFDPALVAGGPIDIETLSSASRDSWLQATALVADGL